MSLLFATLGTPVMAATQKNAYSQHKYPACLSSQINCATKHKNMATKAVSEWINSTASGGLRHPYPLLCDFLNHWKPPKIFSAYTPELQTYIYTWTNHCMPPGLRRPRHNRRSLRLYYLLQHVCMYCTEYCSSYIIIVTWQVTNVVIMPRWAEPRRHTVVVMCVCVCVCVCVYVFHAHFSATAKN